jgi:hypothetical protein
MQTSLYGEVILKSKFMKKLPISIGILAWDSGQVLVDTLTTYYENGLFDITDDVTILFQEVNLQDIEIAKHFGLDFIGLQKNIGIGMGLLRLAENSQNENVLLLEHDWNLIENKEKTYQQLSEGIELLNSDYKCIRYRHRFFPGYPHFSIERYRGKELEYFDDYYQMKYPHLLDCVHWVENPDEKFPEFIQKHNNFYTASSRYGNWTNNPCMYKTDFYVNICKPFINGNHITSEGEIAKWWALENYKVAHGNGLFKHNDYKKYGK